MEQIGFVINTKNDMARVVVNRVSACGGSCSSCGSSCNTNGVELEIKNTLGAKPGDYVELRASASQILKTAFIVYLFPLLAMIAGIAGGITVFKSKGYENYETYGFVVGLVFLGLSYVVLKIIDAKVRKNNKEIIEMISIITK
ncbi:positive regulator of sigma(E), RseC/MucC [Proteiniborus ethanoligenes]|uniref:Positive regulator of sigma(E), RseC/MucC n=1 Tax=Proteiniborus ethanoligenes TaxID=415015 RepID=A0A1H3QSG2_9FIRM|nr:SoxR reducing system RseC family protein [Proteiniborus ethanoligenes]TAH63245.1 MAG: Fis family transcriptional regulator [Gottschalkiaceae bacterium]SDZ16346.1 positive regulator of sigma(E), RseC/MucC [Proteiniborus ethanoligenes]